jgi:hypothetical protein
MSALRLQACFRLPELRTAEQCEKLQLLIDQLQELASLREPACELQIQVEHEQRRKRPAAAGV